MWKQYVEDFTLKHLLLFETRAREIYQTFVYKHSEAIEILLKLAYILWNLQTSWANNSRILRIKNVKFSWHGNTQVMSYELQVQIHELRVQIHDQIKVKLISKGHKSENAEVA